MSNLITNENFLRAGFGAEFARAHVTSFREDPTALEGLGLKGYWGGRSYGTGTGIDPEANNYFTISLFKPDPVDGRARRRKALFEACHVIVVDDVGTKVRDTSKLPAPSWVLETSQGNQQWGYILATPETDAGRVNALLDGMVAQGLAADGRDPGMKGVTRYVRLPVGRNTKRGGTWACVLRVWRPDLAVTMDQLAGPWGIELPAPGASLSGGSTRGAVMSAQDDPVFGLLDKWGMVVGSRAADGVGWNIECPWIDHHTDRTDTGTAYWAGGAIRCHHGHCDTKGRADLLAWVNARLYVEEGFTLAGLDFKDADKPALEALWRVLVAGGVLTSQDVRSLVLVPSPGIDRLLRDARFFLGTNTTPIRRALGRARKRLAHAAGGEGRGVGGAKIGTTVPMPTNTLAPVSLAEAHASVAAVLARLPFNAAAKASNPRQRHPREAVRAC
jgi:hypothetical protein